LTTSNFIDAINAAPPDITDTNLVDLLSLAIEFGFTRLLGQIMVHGQKFPGPRSTTWHGEGVHHLLANRPSTIFPIRDSPIMNFTCSLGELVGDGSPEVGQTSRFLTDHQTDESGNEK
jgi:hypothetical protein